MIFEGHRILEDLDVCWITQVFAPFKFVYARCLFFFSILKYIDGDGCSVERTIIDPSIQMTYHGAPADPLYSSAMTRCSIGSRGSILRTPTICHATTGTPSRGSFTCRRRSRVYDSVVHWCLMDYRLSHVLRSSCLLRQVATLYSSS